MAHHGEATTVVEASPDEVFATITDLEHLTDWNAALRAGLAKELRASLDAVGQAARVR